MKTLMIVEDEEQVRSELIRLIRRSDVPIDTILECSNGREALQQIRERQVDLVFTDIRMPEMDGCELTEEISRIDLPGIYRRTKVVVVSGMENFQCAVELLKYGARDYILKPASFEAVNDVLRRMELEIRREEKRLQEIDWVYRQHVRNLLKKGERENEEAWDILENMFAERNLQDNPYRLILTNPSAERFPCTYKFHLDKVNGDLYMIGEEYAELWETLHPEGYCIGISQTHSTVCEIAQAYKEALEARKTAFVKGVPAEVYKEYERANTLETGAEAERFLQQFLTDKIEALRKRFRHLCFEAKHDRISAASLVEMMDELSARLGKNYEAVYSRKTGGEDAPVPLNFETVEHFGEGFDRWISACRVAVQQKADNSRKNDKILQAIEYIHENYQKELNLAIVSNHISMNYSMFSNAFKKYTGVNFVNYLKEIRIREARKLLVETDKKIAEIGALVGYGNDKHFMKTFKAICGVSPSEYRRNKDVLHRKQKAETEQKGPVPEPAEREESSHESEEL